MTSRNYGRTWKPTGHMRDKTSLRRSFFLKRQREHRESHNQVERENAMIQFLTRELASPENDPVTSEMTEPLAALELLGCCAPKPLKTQASICVSKLLMHHDTMLDIPGDLATDWFVYQKPEGHRVFLMLNGERCYIFNKQGELVRRVKSALPCIGSTVLDAIMIDPDNAPVTPSKQDCLLMLIDCLVWNNSVLLDASAECRHFLLESRYAEAEDKVSVISPENECRLLLVEKADATADNITKFYHTRSIDVRPDGLMFLHKSSTYTPGPSIFNLLYRDSSLSRYVIHYTSPEEALPSPQVATLKFIMRTGHLLTEDFIIMYAMDPCSLRETLSELPTTAAISKFMRRPPASFQLVRVTFGKLNIAIHDNPDPEAEEPPHLMTDVKIIGTPSSKRIYADTFNLIAHQYIMRIRQLEPDSPPKDKYFDFDRIVECSATGEAECQLLYTLNGAPIEERIFEFDSDAPSEIHEQQCQDDVLAE